ncbi:MAG: apolipoprotein N-acyltransferase [Candidatus Cloacimonetes bacterium]|nr:apolipoprotein N-acyltransferase [Candidatus Cloacimonadota bacterium]
MILKLVDRRFSNILLPGISALLLGISRHPLALNFLVFFSFIPLFIFFSQRRSVKNLLVAAFTFATVYNLIALHWISLVTLPGFLGMFLLFTTYFFILFIFVEFTSKSFPSLSSYTLILYWLCFEFLSNFGEFRFPWFNLAYSISEYLLLIQIADIGGIYLLSFLILIVNILLFNSFHCKKNFLLILMIIILWVAYGVIRIKTINLKETNTKVFIAQGSIPQDEKWDIDSRDRTIKIYSEFTEEAGKNDGDLIVWPESAIPLALMRNVLYYRYFSELARKNKINILTGFPHFEFTEETGKNPEPYFHYNSCTQIKEDGKYDPLYFKNILVPFGERIPFLDTFPVLWKIQLGQANFEYGKEIKLYSIDSLKYSPIICFEIAFPLFTNRIARQNADFIVNITNDAWFKKSWGTYQHAIMTQMRAVESRIQYFRSANTGYSIIVSPIGEVTKRLNLFERGLISENVEVYPHQSFYVRFGYLLSCILLTAATVVFFLAVFRRITKK